MDIYNLCDGGWGSNCYILISHTQTEKGRPAAVIDPSAPADKILSFLKCHGAMLEKIILTHGHFDHILSLDELRDRTSAPAYIHKDDNEMLPDGAKNAYTYFFRQEKAWCEADMLLSHGDKLEIGDEALTVLSTPGHSKGSICLLGDGILFTGDTLFDGNIGRCDLYGGSNMQMYYSLGKLQEYDQALTIYPGHGGSTTLGNALSGLMQI